jgi:The  BURPS668_1122 family of deaminases
VQLHAGSTRQSQQSDSQSVSHQASYSARSAGVSVGTSAAAPVQALGAIAAVHRARLRRPSAALRVTVSRAHSQVGNDSASQRDGFVSLPPEGQRILTPLPNPRSTLDRAQDTEYKILENFAQQNRGNTNVSGRIDLFTERPPCDSCNDVINRQFANMFPNMQVRIYHNNGQITTYTNGVPTTITVTTKNPGDYPPTPPGK